MKSTKVALSLLTIIIFVSRIFFLDAGYGSEEDAWGVALTAKHISQSGVYEASRLPGHPLQELLYASIYSKTNAFGMNAVTAIFSLIASIFFFLILKKLNLNQPFLTTIAFAFTPIIYVHSSDSMDYLWALAFIMMSYYWLLNDRVVFSGILLGMAVGCRITSILMVIPFIIHIYYKRKDSWKNILIFEMFVMAISILLYCPVYQKYGIGFFHYYDQFPYPSFSKVIFKASIGVWGSLGCIGIVLFLVNLALNFKNIFFKNIAGRILIYSWLMIIILYLGLYFMLPQKSAYLIPIVPFIILFADYILTRNNFRILVGTLIISSFFFGINLSDKKRGGEPSQLSESITIGGQKVNLDLLYGLVFDDHFKRKTRIKFTNQIIDNVSHLNNKSVIISGWWLNQILIESNEKYSGKIKYVYSIGGDEMKSYFNQGFDIYFLPEMDSINDLRYRIKFTRLIAKQLNI